MATIPTSFIGAAPLPPTEGHDPALTPHAARYENVWEGKLVEVVQITREMFPGEPEIEVMRDPDDPDYPFLVVTVGWEGDATSSVARRLEWHRRIAKLAPGHEDMISLSLVPGK